MTTPHYLFDTPQGRAHHGAIAARLRAHLHNKPDPMTQAAGWWEYYVERYVEPGLEGLSGPDACYHFKDAALYVYLAMTALYGLGFDAFTPPSKRQDRALALLAKGYGRRYVRGLQGLSEALTEHGASKRDLDLFDAQGEAFSAAFERQLTAAHNVNLITPTPSAVADAISLFARELLRVCDWLDGTPHFFEAISVRYDIGEALTKLDTQATTQAPRRKRNRR